LSALEWFVRGTVVAFGCWWVSISVLVCADLLRERPRGYIRAVTGLVVAKSLPGGLAVAAGVTFRQTYANFAVALAVGAWMVGNVLEWVAIRVGVDDG